MALVCNLPASHSWHKSLNTSINLHFTPEILTSVTLLLVTFVFSSLFLTVISTLFYHIDHILLSLSRPGGCHFFLLVKRGDVKKYCIMWEEMKKFCPFCPPPLPPSPHCSEHNECNHYSLKTKYRYSKMFENTISLICLLCRICLSCVCEIRFIRRCCYIGPWISSKSCLHSFK